MNKPNNAAKQTLVQTCSVRPHKEQYRCKKNKHTARFRKQTHKNTNLHQLDLLRLRGLLKQLLQLSGSSPRLVLGPTSSKIPRQKPPTTTPPNKQQKKTAILVKKQTKLSISISYHSHDQQEITQKNYCTSTLLCILLREHGQSIAELRNPPGDPFLSCLLYIRVC